MSMENTSLNSPVSSPKLLDQVRDKIRLKHYSIRTEQAYTEWIKRYILFFGKRHPRDMGAREVEQFLTHLAVNGKVAASTQNQDKAALLFLYKEVLAIELPWLDNVQQAKAPKRLPVVLNRDEIQAILLRLNDTTLLIASLLFAIATRPI
jgi:integrase